MIDTSKERFNESPGLKKWADLQNLKEAARIQSVLAEKGINSFEELDEKTSSLHQRSKTARKTTSSLDRQLEEAKHILDYARRYAQKHIYEERYEKTRIPNAIIRSTAMIYSLPGERVPDWKASVLILKP